MMDCDRYVITVSYDDLSDTDSAIHSDSADSDEMDCSGHPPMSCHCNAQEGVKLEMWRHSTSMKSVVNFVIALKRMTKIKPMSSEFGEEEVLKIIMDNVIQERHASRVAVTPSYVKTSTVLQCIVCDQFRKTLIKSSTTPRLLAVTLRDGNSEFKVQFSLSLYASPSASEDAAQPVCLGISKTNLFLACTELNSSPHLVLKEINTPLNTIKAGDPNDNLLFFRKETGVAYNTFESVKYPGWFISTSYEDYEPVDMCQMSSDRFKNFTLEEKKILRS